jgi:hypothetical protein
MNLNDFINALALTGFFGKNTATIVVECFDAAQTQDPPIYVSNEAAKTWLNGTRNCVVASYFPDGLTNDSELNNHFRRKIKSEWREQQNAFKKIIKDYRMDDENRIDVLTINPDVFYWSLLNQFQNIHGLKESESFEQMIERFRSVVDLHLPKPFLRNIHRFTYFSYHTDTSKGQLSLEDDWLDKTNFVIDAIDTDIIKPFERSFRDNITYRNIMEFNRELYFCTSTSGLHALFSYSKLHDELIRSLGTLRFLYNEICGEE